MMWVHSHRSRAPTGFNGHKRTPAWRSAFLRGDTLGRGAFPLNSCQNPREHKKKRGRFGPLPWQPFFACLIPMHLWGEDAHVVGANTSFQALRSNNGRAPSQECTCAYFTSRYSAVALFCLPQRMLFNKAVCGWTNGDQRPPTWSL